MIWAKTDAGRAEMQSRALIKDRARRNLLLVIDGIKTDEMLLANLIGIGPQDFLELSRQGLIQPASGSVTLGGSVGAVAAATTRPGALGAPESIPPTIPLPLEPQPLDYGQFTTALTKLISANLGLRGFTLTLAVEKASTIEEVRDVADRTIEQIRDRKGEAAAAAAKKTLYGV